MLISRLGLPAPVGWVMACLMCGAAPAALAQSADLPPEQEEASEPLTESDEQRITLEFLDVGLRQILKAFSMKTGLNVIAAGDVGDQHLTLYLEEVSVLDALDQILRAGNLTYDRQPGSDIIIVRPIRVPDAPELITRVYRLRFARVSTSVLARTARAFGDVTPFEAAQFTGGSADGGGGGGTAASVGIDVILETLLSEFGSLTVDERTNTLIVTDTAASFPRIEAALSVLDVKTPQILVDAEVIETGATVTEDIGVEWGSGSDGTLITFIPAARSTRFPYNQNFWGNYDNAVGLGDGSVSVFSATAPTGEDYGIIRSNEAQAVIQALRTHAQTKVLARPKVLTLDNESAIIRLSTNQAVGFESNTDGQGGASVEPIREITGVILVVTPQVNDDGFITMLVEPTVTQVVAAQVSPPTGLGDVVDPKTRSVRTLVRIKNGDTLVVGGLIDRREQFTERRVPFLSSIPVIGKAFTNTETSDTATELIAFITPHVLDDMANPTLSYTSNRGDSVPPSRPRAFPGREQDDPAPGRQRAVVEALE